MVKDKDSEVKEGEYALLESMFPKAKDLTIKEIMKSAPYSSYERNNSYLKSLAKKKIIEGKKIGKTYVFSLISDNWSSKKAFYSYALERSKTFSGANKIISLALKEIPEEDTELIMIFGSYSKGIPGADSDIDLIIVSENKEKVDVDLTSIRRRYNLKIHPIIIPKTEFIKIKNENKELWASLVANGIIFKGYELFYHYAYTN
ncbi:MAG: nucleotidyltransferase domain-containing protein [archaeon]